MRVWIDQDLCTGDGLCIELCPEIFGWGNDGLAYVKEVAWPDVFNSTNDPVYKMAQGTASVPDSLAEATIESAEECPGECIFIEVD